MAPSSYGLATPTNPTESLPAMTASDRELIEELDKQRKSVDAESYDMIIRQLLDMVSDGSINIAPDYQRQFVWDEERQSELIESIYLSIPIPPLFFAENKDGTLEVIDGVQRISTIVHFCGDKSARTKINRKDPLKLDGLKKLATFNGNTFDDLPSAVRNRFLLRSVRITTLNDKADVDVRYDLFQRLNTGGVTLHAQEIRNCVYRGPFNDELHKLAQDTTFRSVVHTPANVSEKAMREECVLRFFAYLERYLDFDKSVEDFLSGYMKDNAAAPLSADLSDIFSKTFKFLKAELPQGITRNKAKVTPINLFEGVSVGTGLVFKAGLKPKKGVLSKLISSPELRKFTSVGTNARSMVRGRIELVRDKLMP